MKKVELEELDLLLQIKSKTGSGSQEEKVNLLKKGFKSKLFQEMLKVAFDTRIVTHIADIPVNLPVTKTCHDFETISGMLMGHNINNEIRKQATDYVNSFENKDHRIILSQILTKSLNIGVGVKTINKAFGSELIFEKSVMLASDDVSKADEWFEKGVGVFEEEKFDGNRVMLLYGDTFFDGELTGKDRQSISGKVNSILKGKGVANMDRDWTYNVFYVGPISLLFGEEERRFEEVTFLTRGFKELPSECLSYITKEFYKIVSNKQFCGIKSLPYSEMRRELLQLFDISNVEFVNLKPVPSLPVTSMKVAQERFQQYLRQGCEGLVLKSGDHYYENDRSTNWIKFKGLNECEMKIVGWYQGKPYTKREEFGGFIVESEDGVVRVEVGIGFRDSVIKEILETGLDVYKGKIMTVLYNMKIVNKEGQKSLYLPRFKEFRFDKKEANFDCEIKER